MRGGEFGPPGQVWEPAQPNGTSVLPAGWLLLELPTALLLAIWVGTGWLGYLGSERPALNTPTSVVVGAGGPGAATVPAGRN
ncbi:MAG: hypothetical protein J2P18_19760 [Nocardia sp.]|nr:hypothetical protein [Nocardia sp.]